MSFRFKRFTVQDDRCAMKVGTDGVLLGAWCPVKVERGMNRFLDVGTGSGLIALMLAQRCETAAIDAIDIDAEAVCQAAENFAQSPWAGRLSVQQISLQEFVKNRVGQYDLVVSNPPYFVNSLKNPDALRQAARHTDTLSYSDLVACAAQLLREDGVLALILPAEAEAVLADEAAKAGLFPFRVTHVYSKPGNPVKRVLAAFRKGEHGECEKDVLYIESEKTPRSDEYAELTWEFYL